MSKARSLDDLWMEATNLSFTRLLGQQFLSNSPPNLGNLYRVLLPSVKDAGLAGPHNLSDTGEAMKRGGIEQTISITLEFRTLILPGIPMPARFAMA